VDFPSDAPRLRYVLIGCAAGIASTHLNALRQIPAHIVGMSDVAAERGAAQAANAACPFFTDHRDLLRATKPDVAIITTPHPFHAPIALDCFAAGAHVLVEKPIAVEVSEADQMIEAAARTGRILAVNFQQRFRPVVARARALIEAGEVGPLVRVLCVEPWYRPAAYYRSAGWRGTWRGEGGGVLMNQAIHPLDLLCHLAGLPVKVWAWNRTRRHAIETEDTSQALLEFANGAPGYFVASTVEAGVPRRLQIIGEKAGLEIVGEQLLIYRFTPSLLEHMLTSTALYQAPQIDVETVTLEGDGGGHGALHRDLYEAVMAGGKPRIDGREGLMSLELANAFILSSHTERAVMVPVERAAYAALLEELRAGVKREP
jgi:predicted dehydrogenase